MSLSPLMAARRVLTAVQYVQRLLSLPRRHVREIGTWASRDSRDRFLPVCARVLYPPALSAALLIDSLVGVATGSTCRSVHILNRLRDAPLPVSDPCASAARANAGSDAPSPQFRATTVRGPTMREVRGVYDAAAEG